MTAEDEEAVNLEMAQLEREAMELDDGKTPQLGVQVRSSINYDISDICVNAEYAFYPYCSPHPSFIFHLHLKQFQSANLRQRCQRRKW